MSGAAVKVGRFLRSRKVAVWLLLTCAAWSVVGTSVPAAFTSPVFIVLLGWLTTSTAWCAWERTRSAFRALRAHEGVPTATIARLEAASVIVTIPGDVETARTAVTGALRSIGLKSRATPRVVEGRSGRLGLLGSPLFHWSLALLFLVIAAGQLTRSEGLIGVPVGGAVDNVPPEYGIYSQGPMRGARNQDLAVAVTAMSLENVVDGVDRGPTPTVQLRRSGRTVAQGAVYPNSPLRYGSVLVHFVDRGFVAVFAISDADGTVVDLERAYFDFDEGTELGLGSGSIDLAATGIAGAATVAPTRRDDPADAPRVRITIPGSAGVEPDLEMAVGDSLKVGESTLTLESVSEYARLSVVDDWSVYLIYLLFGLATVGVTLAVLVPTRTTWALLTQVGDDVEVRALTLRPGRDPAFEESVLLELGRLGSGNRQTGSDD